MANKIAKIIRIVTVPPIMVLALLVVLYFTSDMFASITQLLLSILFLMLIPILSYPVAELIPSIKAKGREGQRNLAFAFTPVGYLAAVLYGIFAHVSSPLLMIYLTYLISVIVLTMFNKLFKLRASGHSCSITGPLILLVYFTGIVSLLPCLVLFSLVMWSSLRLKRHTVSELVYGGLSSTSAFFISLIIISFI